MIPVFAIVGRPNVGKSTLFNVLTRTRNALVLDAPGITRDRQYGQGEFENHKFIVIDTGGLTEDKNKVNTLMVEQSEKAINEADCVFFMVDAISGRLPLDENIAKRLRHLTKPIYLLVNKTDGKDHNIALSDFYALGFSNKPIPISSSQREGIEEFLGRVFQELPQETIIEQELDQKTKGIKIAIVGRPNVGKSTLVNRMLGEDRVIVLDEPGTTRDSIYVPLEREGEEYTLIDTAGVRRRGRIHETLEKFSVVKTLQSIEASDVVIMVMDAKDGITDQDLALLGFIVEAGKALVIAVNKWDNLPQDQRTQIKRETKYRLNFANFARIHWISALHGTGVGNLFDAVHEAYASATRTIGTGELNRILEKAIMMHQPPIVGGHRIKLRYAHMGGHQPPIVIIHGNQTESVPHTYRRYLSNTFIKALKLWGTPVRVEFKTSKNPYVNPGKKPVEKSKRGPKRRTEKGKKPIKAKRKTSKLQGSNKKKTNKKF